MGDSAPVRGLDRGAGGAYQVMMNFVIALTAAITTAAALNINLVSLASSRASAASKSALVTISSAWAIESATAFASIFGGVGNAPEQLMKVYPPAYPAPALNVVSNQSTNVPPFPKHRRFVAGGVSIIHRAGSRGASRLKRSEEEFVEDTYGDCKADDNGSSPLQAADFPALLFHLLGQAG